MTSKILFRVDGNEAVGLGHLSRCLALCEHLAELRVSSEFLGSFGRDGLRMLTEAHAKWVPMNQAVGSLADQVLAQSAINERQFNGIVFDSYNIDSDYIDGIRSKRLLKVLIDDSALLKTYDADIVVNWTIGADRFNFPLSANGPQQRKLLLGPSHFMCRRALSMLRGARQLCDEIRRLVIVVSGDGSDDICRVLLSGISDFLANDYFGPEITISLYCAEPVLEKLKSSDGHLKLSFTPDMHDFDPNVADKIAQADLVVCTGGLIKYESLFLGKPTLSCARTQRELIDTAEFAKLGAVIDLGAASALKPDRVKQALENVFLHPIVRQTLASSAKTVFSGGFSTGVAQEIAGCLRNRA
jgi:UDP-2,4-diacetamido-2,4,6-trideoxy-beta-L-altropyranose hydrolase